MRRWIGVPALMFAFASSAHAAPGDPRLVQGILEWPPKLTVEPFVVVRTDDGRWYYAEIKAAKRLESAADRRSACRRPWHRGDETARGDGHRPRLGRRCGPCHAAHAPRQSDRRRVGTAACTNG